MLEKRRRARQCRRGRSYFANSSTIDGAVPRPRSRVTLEVGREESWCFGNGRSDPSLGLDAIATRTRAWRAVDEDERYQAVQDTLRPLRAWILRVFKVLEGVVCSG